MVRAAAGNKTQAERVQKIGGFESRRDKRAGVKCPYAIAVKLIDDAAEKRTRR